MIRTSSVTTKEGRKYSTVVISSPLKVLNDIFSHLRGANGSPFYKLNGMFLRSYDFERSARSVKAELHSIEVLAHNFSSKGFLNDEFQKAAKLKGIILHSRTSNSFSTLSLGVELRHFINDTCRVLESSIRLLEAKTNFPRKSSTDSLNQYLSLLDKKNVSYNFDGDFFKALYHEIWNDYKHEESSGIDASGCTINQDGTIMPIIKGVRLNYFKDKSAESFVDDVLDNVKQYVDFIRE